MSHSKISRDFPSRALIRMVLIKLATFSIIRSINKQISKQIDFQCRLKVTCLPIISIQNKQVFVFSMLQNWQDSDLIPRLFKIFEILENLLVRRRFLEPRNRRKKCQN